MKNNPPHIVKSLILLLGLTYASHIAAQTQAINGSIRGRVTDQTMSPIAQTNVKVENTDTAFTRSAQTPDEGSYGLRTLPLGSYTLIIQKEGFELLPHTGII